MNSDEERYHPLQHWYADLHRGLPGATLLRSYGLLSTLESPFFGIMPINHRSDVPIGYKRDSTPSPEIAPLPSLSELETAAMDPPTINDVTKGNDLLLRILLFSCRGQPGSVSNLAQVSKGWNGMLTYWKPCCELFESPSNFGTENSFFGDTKGLSTHFHFAYWGNNILDPGFYKSLDTFTSIACLEVWIGEDTIPLLSQDHPQLRQLILSRPSTASDGDGSGARSAHWIANAPCLKNIRSLHLIKPYPEVLKAFSELPSPPPLVEFHVNIPSFQNHGCESLSTSLCIFMDKLGPNLETFDLRCTLLPQGTAPPPLIRLESLKELRLHALDRSDPGGILPLNVSTPKLERLIDHHHVLSGLYHTGVSTITFLGDWSPEWNPHTYISAPNLKYLYLEDEAKLSMLQQYLLANTTICTSLELIEVYSVSVEKKKKTTWMRGTTTIVLVEIPFTEEGSHIFEERPWTCDVSSCLQLSV